jgi:hypothetical protein
MLEYNTAPARSQASGIAYNWNLLAIHEGIMCFYNLNMLLFLLVSSLKLWFFSLKKIVNLVVGKSGS